jgi:hypothetical protein
MDKPRYVSYLLRLWQTESEGQLVWRASLESPQTGERTGFRNLDALFAFLRQQSGEGPVLNSLDDGREQHTH